jgi:hypothetical protein
VRSKPTHIAEDLGIRLPSKEEEKLFKWFLVCLLFGKPIQQQLAERAFRVLSCFAPHNIGPRHTA